MAEKKYYGLYQGVVTNINDPEKRGRIKVKCPDVLGGTTESAWCDPLVPVAYDYGGDFCIPAKEETVWVQFIAGDANRPVWLGGWWQKNMTPLGSNYSSVDQVRIINYAGCTILMRDDTIEINAGGGSSEIRIEQGTVTIDGDLMVHGKVTAGELEITTDDGLGDVTIANNLNVTGNSELTGTLKVLDKSTLKATTVTTLSASGKATFNKDVVAKTNVEVTQDVKVTGNVEVTENVKVTGDLEVEGATKLTTTLEVGEDLTVTGTTKLAETEATEITATGDVKAGSVSLSNHTHSCSEGGTGGAQ